MIINGEVEFIKAESASESSTREANKASEVAKYESPTNNVASPEKTTIDSISNSETDDNKVVIESDKGE